MLNGIAFSPLSKTFAISFKDSRFIFVFKTKKRENSPKKKENETKQRLVKKMLDVEGSEPPFD
jgi:hypothetical protein